MSDRPTPRTDSAIMEIPSKFGSICVVRVELALDLERELGEALDDLQVLRSNKMSDPLLETTFKHLNHERDEACQVANGLAKQVERLSKERDEAIARSKEWSDWCVEYKSERDEAREKYDQICSQTLIEINKVCDERDAAIIKYTGEADELERQRNHAIAKCEDARRERDEAREALDCLLAVIGLTPIAGNKHALQDAVDYGLAVLRKQQEAAK